MPHHDLPRNYFFEFAGMPQSGKTSTMDSVAHFLQREGYPLGEPFYGGSKYSPLYNAPRGSLNTVLACKAVEFVVSMAEREPNSHKIFLLDKGLIDRYIFTDTLRRCNELDPLSARHTIGFLTSPQIIKLLDGVFIFSTLPEVAVRRKNEHKLVQTEGEVVNIKFLSVMRSAIEDGYREAQTLVPNVHLLNLEREGQEQKAAEFIRDNILSTLNDHVLESYSSTNHVQSPPKNQ